jgi:hypothetical protein
MCPAPVRPKSTTTSSLSAADPTTIESSEPQESSRGKGPVLTIDPTTRAAQFALPEQHRLAIGDNHNAPASARLRLFRDMERTGALRQRSACVAIVAVKDIRERPPLRRWGEVLAAETAKTKARKGPKFVVDTTESELTDVQSQAPKTIVGLRSFVPTNDARRATARGDGRPTLPQNVYKALTDAMVRSFRPSTSNHSYSARRLNENN